MSELELGEDVPEVKGDELEVKNPSTPAPNSQMQNVNTESWKDIYVNFAEQDAHIAVNDAYYGTGGFLANVGCHGAICYLTPKITENFYKTRAKTTIFFNQHAPYIDVKVKPVFALGVEDLVKKGDTYLDDDKWLDLVEDASGTGKSLNEIREESDIEAFNHDNSFLVADKAEDENGENRTIFYVKSALDVDEYTIDSNTKRLTSVTFWEPSIKDENDKVIYVKHKWWVDNGSGKLTIYHGKQDGRTSTGYKFEEFETRDTGIDILNAYSKRAEKMPIGCYKSERPKSYAIASIVCGLYNLISGLNYLLFKQGHGLYVFQGKINGLRDALSNIVEIPANEPNGKSYSMPTILTPDPDMPRVHLEIIKEYISFMVGIMGNNGVVIDQKKTAESGISKAFDMIGTVAQYKACIEMDKRADKWMKRIFNKYEAREEGLYTYETNYPTEFTPTGSVDAADLVELAEAFETRGMGAVSAEFFKEVVKLVFKDTSSEDMRGILDIIGDYEQAVKKDSVGNSDDDDSDGDDE
jgi:hypothetical protein